MNLKLTVVVLHIRPQLFLLFTVSERTVADIITLALLQHVNTDLWRNVTSMM